MAKTAFIGLGVMGGPMAGHLARAGHDVRVYNRTEEKARDWAQKHKGRTYTSVAAARRRGRGRRVHVRGQ
jgi:3-hydroxyisobutyrate dehydrogenase-like beta-hydroxyacid dehydrogenase